MTKKTPRKPIRKRIRHAEIIIGFAERLRHLRQSSGLSQAELASRAAVHWTYIGRLEHGLAAPGLDLLDRLAGALKCPLTDLLPVTSVDPMPFLQDQARTRLESILSRGDRSFLGVLNTMLAMMDDTLARNS
ncbi:MAG: helix-turn-helix transcriptional regulator [Planctomycetota bacterium]